MIPKIFAKEHGYAPFPPFISAVPGLVPPGLVRADFAADPQAIPPNANIETILQNHRRKMLRRAANRRSAQLSRARKKAHLEDLKAENSRLQRLVDVLDSQPELVFCVTLSGKITYVSERTMNFMKVNFAGEESDSDDDPTHINQILSKESVSDVLETIAKLHEYSVNRSENDLNMLFSVKAVNFHDAVGQPIVGYLRCSKVHRRTTIQELQVSENIEKALQGPPTKKLKTAKNTSSAANVNVVATINKSSADLLGAINSTNGHPANWNLANFKLLADCVSSLTEEKALGIDTPTSSNDTTTNTSTESQKGTTNLSSSSKKSSSSAVAAPSSTQSLKSKSEVGTPSLSSVDYEEEFVCVIRTSEDCFVPYKSKDILMFASFLSAASIEAHDLELRTTAISPTDRPTRMGSPSESNNSNNSSDVKTTSNSSNQMKNSTSSETGSDDNNVELDDN